MENSQTSQPKGKRSTSQTSKLIPEAALEILSESFRMVEEAGIELDVCVTDAGVQVTVLNASFVDGVLVPSVSRSDAQPAE